MRRFFPAIVLVITATWFGGLITLFVLVQMLFRADRGLALQAAPLMFNTFERLVIALAPVAVVGMIGWRLIVCTTPKKWITALLLGAAVLAVLQTAWVTARMNAMIAGAVPAGDEFKRLHALSMVLYSGQSVLLLVALCLMPWALRAESEYFARSPGTGRA